VKEYEGSLIASGMREVNEASKRLDVLTWISKILMAKSAMDVEEDITNMLKLFGVQGKDVIMHIATLRKVDKSQKADWLMIVEQNAEEIGDGCEHVQDLFDLAQFKVKGGAVGGKGTTGGSAPNSNSSNPFDDDFDAAPGGMSEGAEGGSERSGSAMFGSMSGMASEMAMGMASGMSSYDMGNTLSKNMDKWKKGAQMVGKMAARTPKKK
jgi:hypothetical protein